MIRGFQPLVAGMRIAASIVCSNSPAALQRWACVAILWMGGSVGAAVFHVIQSLAPEVFDRPGIENLQPLAGEYFWLAAALFFVAGFGCLLRSRTIATSLNGSDQGAAIVQKVALGCTFNFARDADMFGLLLVAMILMWFVPAIPGFVGRTFAGCRIVSVLLPFAVGFAFLVQSQLLAISTSGKTEPSNGS